MKYGIQYVNLYSPVGIVKINENDLLDFNSYIIQNGFFEVQIGNTKIEELRILGTERQFRDDFFNTVSKLEIILKGEHKSDFNISNPLISFYLNREINWINGGEKAKIMAVYESDPLIIEARKLLNDRHVYYQYLQKPAITRNPGN